MKIQDITNFLESVAPASLQENYDNAGLLTGMHDWECTGLLTTLDATEAVIMEAIHSKCNLVIAHHPIIFKGLKKINGSNYIERAVICAIKNDIAIYAIHTNLDNILGGVNGKIADTLGLINREVLFPKANMLKKLETYVPVLQAGRVRDALFEAGGGQVGQYNECSFNSAGEGTFKGSDETHPYVGKPGTRHTEPEVKIELIFPAVLERKLHKALLAAHPYEAVACNFISLDNRYQEIGSGLVGLLGTPVTGEAFLGQLQKAFGTRVIRHTPLVNKLVSKIALCGGSGSFLIGAALGAGADFYVTGDIKYHEFFDADGRMVIADVGHWESEQFTVDLLFDILSSKFPTFAVQKSAVSPNPVNYFAG